MKKKKYWIYAQLVFWILICCLCIFGIGRIFAGEKEELALKWRALVAEYQLAEIRFNQVKQEVNEFGILLESKGLMIQNMPDGKSVVVEKPKSAPEKKEEPKK